MIKSVARYCEPPHNWTLLRGDELQISNGTVTSRIISAADFLKGTLSPVGTTVACPSLRNRRSRRQSADRGLKQRDRQRSRLRRKMTGVTTSLEKSSNRRLSYSNPEAEAVPSKKKRKHFSQTSPRHRYILLDLQGQTDAMPPASDISKRLAERLAWSVHSWQEQIKNRSNTFHFVAHVSQFWCGS
jgi:hypothetical protein